MQVSSVVRASDKSFQLKWTETVFERGSQTGTAHWTGILTVVTRTPTSADTLRKNPLGVYIDAIHWSRELEPATPAQPRSPTTPRPQVSLPLGSPLDPNLAVQPAIPSPKETQP